MTVAINPSKRGRTFDPTAIHMPWREGVMPWRDGVE